MTSTPNKLSTGIIETGTLLLILLWGYAAMSKLLEFDKFTVQLSKSPMLSNFANILAIAVPVIEIVIAILLINKKTKLVGLSASVFLLMLFTGYIIAMLKFSDNIPCSCGGIISMLGWKGHIVFNLIFLVLALASTFFEFNKRDTKPFIINEI